MQPTFEKVTAYPRGTLLRLLMEGYSFDARCAPCWREDWQAFDDFFYDNPHIADSCGFITALDGEAIGFVSWDPRNLPDYAEIGHNCLTPKCKGKGYGVLQLQVAVNRILQNDVRSIRVTTNELLVPAQHMYARVGFVLIQTRHNDGVAAFSGDYMDYLYLNP